MAVAPLSWSSFGAEGSSFPGHRIEAQCSILLQKGAISMQNATFRPRPRWAAQRLSKVVDLGWGVVGYEPVHDSEHVTYRLLAPAQSPVGAAANK